MQLNTRLLLHNVKMVPSINVLMSSKKAISTENANPILGYHFTSQSKMHSINFSSSHSFWQIRMLHGKREEGTVPISGVLSVYINDAFQLPSGREPLQTFPARHKSVTSDIQYNTFPITPGHTRSDSIPEPRAFKKIDFKISSMSWNMISVTPDLTEDSRCRSTSLCPSSYCLYFPVKKHL